jgi:uncharacterized phage-associated protein
MEEMRIHKALDIAHKLLQLATNSDDELLTNLKLQKMLYYQQGFHLARFETPLFEEEMEAWMYGPVVPFVYNQFCTPELRGGIPYEGEVVRLSHEEELLFDEVYRMCNVYSAVGLMRMTHAERPWQETPIGKGNIISKPLMQSFFKTRL